MNETRELLECLDVETINELVRMIEHNWFLCPSCNHMWARFQSDVIMSGEVRTCHVCATKKTRTELEYHLKFVREHLERLRDEIRNTIPDEQLHTPDTESYYGNVLGEFMVIEQQILRELKLL